MPLQADHPLRTDLGVVHHPGGQIEPVARVQLKRLIQLRQTERDRTAHHIDDFIIRVRMRRVRVVRPVRPRVRMQALVCKELPKGGFGRGGWVSPKGDVRRFYLFV